MDWDGFRSTDLPPISILGVAAKNIEELLSPAVQMERFARSRRHLLFDYRQARARESALDQISIAPFGGIAAFNAIGSSLPVTLMVRPNF
jgi:hypothetical protein